VRLTRSEAHSQMRWQTNPIDVDEKIILGRFVPASESPDSDEEGPRRRQPSCPCCPKASSTRFSTASSLSRLTLELICQPRGLSSAQLAALTDGSPLPFTSPTAPQRLCSHVPRGFRQPGPGACIVIFSITSRELRYADSLSRNLMSACPSAALNLCLKRQESCRTCAACFEKL